MILVLLTVVLPLHIFIGFRLREPYPALFMPAFGGSPAADGTVSYRSPELIVYAEDGRSREVTPDELLPVPLLATSILSSGFSDGLDADGDLERTEPPGILYRLVVAYSDGRVPGRDTARAYAPETRTWLRKRVQQIWPGVEPDRFVIRWRRVEVSADRPGRTTSVEQRVEVPL